MATISLCMIVKNEKKTLSRCLEGIRNAVDEIIIVDTGSSDNTKNIAKKFTSNIFDFKWCDDFSAARNFSFSKAVCDYIMWLDADDVINDENCRKLIDLKKRPIDEDAIMMKYHTAFDESGNPTFTFYRERLIKKSSFVAWCGKVHEAAQYKGKAVYSDIAIEHHSIKKEYSTRNLDIYERQIENGEALSARDKFYYARELYYHSYYNKAIDILNDFLGDENGWVENKIEACKILSLCYKEKCDSENALKALFNSFLFDTPRAEHCCMIGDLLMQKSEYEKAIFWFETALKLPVNNENGGFTDIDSHGYLPSIQLCMCYDKLKNYKKAQEYNELAGKYRPLSPSYNHNRAYFASLHESGIL